MMFRGSWWLLAVCLLSWCCNTWELSEDPESESAPPLVLFYEIEDMLSKDSFIKLVERLIPGMDIVPLEIGKNVIEDMENNVLNASSEMCQILANDPNLQQGYIPISFFKRLQMLKDLAEKCQIPTMKDMVSVSGRKFKKLIRRLSRLFKRQ